MKEERPLRVFYDGACPLCAREIAFYQKLTGASLIEWIDVSRTDVAELPGGLSRHDALARFHVQTSDGNLVNRAAAFVHLWSALPRFRLVGKTAQIPPILWILERLYNLFLPLRSQLQRSFVCRDKAHCAEDQVVAAPKK